MAQVTGFDSRGMVKALLLAGIVGMVASIWAYLHLGYSLGTAGKFWSGYSYGNQIFGRLQSQISAPVPAQMMDRWAMLYGMVCCTALSAMRMRFLWWPFHPIGYAISGSWSMNLVWMPMLIAWIAKGSILKWGGLRLYRTLLPFFLGLILGDIMMGCLWSLIGIVLGVETYSFWGA